MVSALDRGLARIAQINRLVNVDIVLKEQGLVLLITVLKEDWLVAVVVV